VENCGAGLIRINFIILRGPGERQKTAKKEVRIHHSNSDSTYKEKTHQQLPTKLDGKSQSHRSPLRAQHHYRVIEGQSSTLPFLGVCHKLKDPDPSTEKKKKKKNSEWYRQHSKSAPPGSW